MPVSTLLVLAGGLGSRLKSVVHDRPKALDKACWSTNARTSINLLGQPRHQKCNIAGRNNGGSTRSFC